MRVALVGACLYSNALIILGLQLTSNLMGYPTYLLMKIDSDQQTTCYKVIGLLLGEEIQEFEESISEDFKCSS